ncbi:serine threonine-protein kinase prp4 [Moniliophthora roreri MCA 2997]|uniref:non-specific serine/threonine protein kinase n=1 Tax=Moniliophthora roreri (strain MCA 2997) TaxID=1381753 RepID=V2YBQ6_MONRO|nr:serine threonine-protein kinase prp4 [Moniliophthora roreri MCA 2997]
MTNMPSGSKRTRDGSSGEIRDHKRPREDNRDWRDVHLRSTSSRKPTSARKDSYDRRDRYDSERSRRERDRGRPHHDSRGRRDGSRGSKDDYSTRDHENSPRRYEGTPRSQVPPISHPPREEEREEGEISPRPSPRMTAPPSPPRSPKPPEVPLPEMELDIPPSPPPVEETLATRRAKRQAIMAKYAGIASASGSTSQLSGNNSAIPEHPISTVSNQDSHISTPLNQAANGESGKRGSASPSPSVGQDFALAKDDEDESSEIKRQAEIGQGRNDLISAADYDPSLDRREDEQKRINAPLKVESEVEEVEEEEEDDIDDMFAVATTSKPQKVRKVKKVIKPSAPALITTTLDSAADAEGYYSVILGEQLDGGRYQVFSSLGKGMFANVVRARVLQPEPGEPSGREVAIKIVRCQESMYKAGLKEVQMLNKLRQADPEDKKHIVRLERTFEHRGHLCLVFESLSMNLRDVVKRFGKDVGLNIKAVRAYAHQLFLALSLLKKVGVMHADIKPDNILVNEQKTLLKLCDLGSASDASENDITPYLVSRFYRAPEIILGVPYDPSLDIWSIGCTLYELYTGKILFPGRSNNQMLLLMMELKGRFNGKMIKKAKFGDDYFDEMGGFNSVEKDRVLGTDVVKKVHISKPTRDLRSRLMPPASVKMKDDESKLLLSFIDLLDRCLALDPARRITPKEALTHPFIRG